MLVVTLIDNVIGGVDGEQMIGHRVTVTVGSGDADATLVAGPSLTTKDTVRRCARVVAGVDVGDLQQCGLDNPRRSAVPLRVSTPVVALQLR